MYWFAKLSRLERLVDLNSPTVEGEFSLSLERERSSSTQYAMVHPVHKSSVVPGIELPPSVEVL
jgi:hypothetical protein